ncbi:cuticle protein 16.5-like [Toxorhynchites rutilus septentrionalis]|uniref:cuticle protein 16.5-like n=1 Tax=Toxorhynchites rutilus septentrionalis TaxID=329112 RepID=UPI0024786E16|nr:cuticle protein 16.5-like [Toxorhynchites rutilus septentrionalis]
MSLKLAVILASLACASAGYLEPATPYAAAPLVAPALSYGHGHLNSARRLGQIAVPAVSYNNYEYPAYAAPWATMAVAIVQPNLKYAPAVSYSNDYAPALGYNKLGYSSYAAPLDAKKVVIAEPTPIASDAPLLAGRPALSYAPALSYSNLGHTSYAAPLAAKTIAVAPGSPLLASHSALAYAPISGYAGSFAHHKNPLINYAY